VHDFIISGLLPFNRMINNNNTGSHHIHADINYAVDMHWMIFLSDAMTVA